METTVRGEPTSKPAALDYLSRTKCEQGYFACMPRLLQTPHVVFHSNIPFAASLAKLPGLCNFASFSEFAGLDCRGIRGAMGWQWRPVSGWSALGGMEVPSGHKKDCDGVGCSAEAKARLQRQQLGGGLTSSGVYCFSWSWLSVSMMETGWPGQDQAVL